MFAYWLAGTHQPVNPLFFGGAISVILSALFIIMTRKKLITHIIAFIFLENGIFLFAVSLFDVMPVLIEMGILLDIFVAVFIMAIVVNHINEEFEKNTASVIRAKMGETF